MKISLEIVFEWYSQYSRDLLSDSPTLAVLFSESINFINIQLRETRKNIYVFSIIRTFSLSWLILSDLFCLLTPTTSFSIFVRLLNLFRLNPRFLKHSKYIFDEGVENECGGRLLVCDENWRWSRNWKSASEFQKCVYTTEKNRSFRKARNFFFCVRISLIE